MLDLTLVWLNTTPEQRDIAFKGAVGFFSKLMPTAEQVSLMAADTVMGWRDWNRVRIALKTEKMLKDAGKDTGKVSPKLLIPLLDNASLEDDESLVERWVALLANAANPETSGKVRPTFISDLAQLTPFDAGLLEFVSTFAKRLEGTTFATSRELVSYLKTHSGDAENYDVSAQVLHRLRLTINIRDQDDSIETLICSAGICGLHDLVTPYGLAFLAAVTPPKNTPTGL